MTQEEPLLSESETGAHEIAWEVQGTGHLRKEIMMEEEME